MLSRLKFEISGLVKAILNQVDPALFESAETTFLDPAMGGGQFIFETIRRLKEHGHSNANIKSRVHGFESKIVRINYIKELYFRLFGEEIPATLSVGGLDELEALKMKYDLVMGNPPYNKGGVKKGGGFYIPFVENAISNANRVLFIIPITFMMRTDCKNLRRNLIAGGLTSIKILPIETFPTIDTRTCIILFDKNDESKSFNFTYNGSTLTHSKQHYANGEVIPFTTSVDDNEWFRQVMKSIPSIKIYSGDVESTQWKVSWEYLIGLQKDRYSGNEIVRKIRVVTPDEKLGKEQRYVKFQDHITARHICHLLQENAHRLIKMIPRGSSVENWMMAPLVQYLLDEQVK